MPFWDMIDPNIIRNNRWRCDHGWDIDLDDGSTQYRITNNLLLNGGLKMREGYDRIATNNIIINNSLHPHVWYKNSGDVFKSNIVFAAYRPAVMEKTIASDGKWGKELDYNLFVSDIENMNRFAAHGCDCHSLTGDPLFINATIGDFRVKEGSPALKLGFVNFPMDQYGVTKPALKAIAKTPEIPVLTIKSEKIIQIPRPVFTWMDVDLKEPAGDELSAFGVSYDDGGVALISVKENSAAAQHGFKSGDLIYEINGLKIRNIQNMKKYIETKISVNNHPVFGVIRNQAKIKIMIRQALPPIEKGI
jgi:hypothetical protein